MPEAAAERAWGRGGGRWGGSGGMLRKTPCESLPWLASQRRPQPQPGAQGQQQSLTSVEGVEAAAQCSPGPRWQAGPSLSALPPSLTFAAPVGGWNSVDLSSKCFPLKPEAESCDPQMCQSWQGACTPSNRGKQGASWYSSELRSPCTDCRPVPALSRRAPWARFSASVLRLLL